jgi:aryl-alcohol dehydrogenase-like predicted oxidoreductase
MPHSSKQLTRREVLRAGIVAGAGMLGGRLPLAAHPLSSFWLDDLLTKPIPSTGERIPVVGVGTNAWSVTDPAEVAERHGVLRALVANGGTVVDTARGYGRAEEVIGEGVSSLGIRDRLFVATKFSLGGGNATEAAARAGLEEAFSRLRTDVIDVMMVHNFGGTDVLMPLLREYKEAGRFRYIGVSTSSEGQYPALLSLMEREPLDFVQVDYSIGNRSATERVLPLAQDRGIAIMTNVPFGGRRAPVFTELQGVALPDFAAEIGASSFAQLFLKYLVSHPAVTVAIPGTRRDEHMIDNLGGARGPMPDAAFRRRIEEWFDRTVA